MDLSEGGAQLHIAAPLEDGAIHDFALDLDGQRVWVQAEVRRSEPARGGGYLVGVEFVGIDPQDKALLRRWLTRH
jgi:hypothetical protein